MNDDPWNALLAAEAAVQAYLSGPQGAMAVAATDPDFTHAKKNVSAALDQWPNFKANLAAFSIGIGFFVLGAIMLAFSAFEDIADLAEKALGIAGDPAGAAVGKRPNLAAALEVLAP